MQNYKETTFCHSLIDSIFSIFDGYQEHKPKEAAEYDQERAETRSLLADACAHPAALTAAQVSPSSAKKSGSPDGSRTNASTWIVTSVAPRTPRSWAP